MLTEKREPVLQRISRRFGIGHKAIVTGQTFTSRLFSSWDNLTRVLAVQNDSRIKNYTLQDKIAMYNQMVRRFKWHIEQPVSRPEQVELLALCPRLLLATSTINAETWPRRYKIALSMEEKARNGLNKFKNDWPEETTFKLRRRLLATHFSLIRQPITPDVPNDLLKWIILAAASGVLKNKEWEGLIEVAMKAQIPPEDLVELAISLYSYCGSRPGEIRIRLDSELEKIFTTTKQISRKERDQHYFKLQRLHFAAPWLVWPVILLAKTEIDEQQFVIADQKLSVLHSILGDQPIRTDVSFLLGKIKYYNENYELADRYFDEALKGGVDVTSVHEFVAIAKANAGDLQTALEHIESALSHTSGDNYLLTQKANVLLGLGRISKAKGIFMFVLEEEKENIDACYGIAKIEEAQGNIEKAQMLLFDIIERTSDHLEARCSLAAIFANQKRHTEALEILQALLAIAPSYYPALVEFGICQIESGLATAAPVVIEGGIATLQQCQKVNDSDPRVVYYLGRAYSYKRQFAKCLEYLLSFQELLGDSNVLHEEIFQIRLSLALELVNDGHLEKAAELLQTLIATSPDMSEIRVLLCEVQLQRAFQALERGTDENVLDFSKQVLAFQPGRPQAHLLEMIVRFRRGELDRELLDKALAVISEGPEKEIISFLVQLFEQKIPLDVDVATSNFAISFATLPVSLQSSKLMVFLSSVIDMIANNDRPFEKLREKYKDLLSHIITQKDNHGLDAPQFSWWMAHQLLRDDFLGEFEKLVSEARSGGMHHGDCDVVQMIRVLLQISNKATMHQGLLHFNGFLQTLPPEISGYIGSVYCYKGYQELLKANKDPKQIHNAIESFGQARKIWAQNYEECTSKNN